LENIEQLIDALHLEDLKNPLHPSIFDEDEGYNMLILRLPNIQNELETTSYGFILTHEHSYFYNRDEGKFQKLDTLFEGPHKFMDKPADKLLKSFGKFQDLAVTMEETLYEDTTTGDFMQQWLTLKRDILHIERVLLRASSALSQFIEFYDKNDAFPMNHYVDLHEHIDRTMRAANTQLTKLDYLYNFYNARTNERMNRLIYFLTIISAIFLPLNLVVGFFGMNTSGLPFATGTSGTLNAIALMLSLMTVTSIVVYIWHRKTGKS